MSKSLSGSSHPTGDIRSTRRFPPGGSGPGRKSGVQLLGHLPGRHDQRGAHADHRLAHRARGGESGTCAGGRGIHCSILYHSINGVVADQNTVQLMPVALLLWMVLLGVREGRWWQWVIAGVAAAACLLTKYSAVIWFAVMGVWVLLGSLMRTSRAWRHRSGYRCVPVLH